MQTERKGPGCWTIGCGTVVILLIASVATLHYVFWHTTVPLKAIVGLINTDQHLKVKGVSGSFARGVTISECSYSHTNGLVSYVRDVGYSHNDLSEIWREKRLIIHDAHARDAHLYFFPDAWEKHAHEDHGTVTHEHENGTTSEGGELELFQIDRFAISNVVIEAPNRDYKLTIDTATLDGLTIDKTHVAMNGVTIDSSALKLHIDPFEGKRTAGEGMDATIHAEGELRPDLHALLVGALPFNVDYNVAADEFAGMTISLCDGTVRISKPSATNEATLTADAFPLGKYLANCPVDALTLRSRIAEEAPGMNRLTIDSGSFTVGKARFDLDPATYDLPDKAPETAFTFTAHSRVDDTRKVAARLDVGPAKADPFVRVALDVPAADDAAKAELLARLFFDKPPAALTADERAALKQRAESLLSNDR